MQTLPYPLEGELTTCKETVIIINRPFTHQTAVDCYVLYAFTNFCCCSAKRSRHAADSHRTTGDAEVEPTLFHVMVQQAGLHLSSGQVQDELGEFSKVCVCISP